MKPYSIDLREKIVSAYEKGDTSIRGVAVQFGIAKSYVQKLIRQKRLEGHLEPKKQGGAMKGKLDDYGSELAEMVQSYPDLTLLEYCEYFGEKYNIWVCASVMCCALQKQELTRKKRLYVAAKRKQKESKN
ncbi:helix-turn-helix domain-containing protein [Calothrix sp. NIES-3974]|uniref:helix-turn-helix domain-containing protein n=1 Tax=Calothrix sp. NIES-3974 TaxID=2005462 RepID=UPI000B5EE675|nr:IS630 transposase-related protein [Calothrix sp. NIES-3974]BAZ03448.1 transposase [Calothrix sp. NIES-3974]BAZ03866.1 transposase [Calothrix sp. NIES-3974]BAZ03889.1 transposase [Calothrix sp. NIES-3974]BAZ04101.1 transposase [Calothrix sp. NIES-3974]BAZ04306.1 transposase [Calothrix sp. NIES-3974]